MYFKRRLTESGIQMDEDDFQVRYNNILTDVPKAAMAKGIVYEDYNSLATAMKNAIEDYIQTIKSRDRRVQIIMHSARHINNANKTNFTKTKFTGGRTRRRRATKRVYRRRTAKNKRATK